MGLASGFIVGTALLGRVVLRVRQRIAMRGRASAICSMEARPLTDVALLHSNLQGGVAPAGHPLPFPIIVLCPSNFMGGDQRGRTHKRRKQKT